MGSIIAPAGATAATTGALSTTRVTATSAVQSEGESASLEYDPTNTTSIGGYATTSEVSVALGGGTGKASFSVDFSAPSGQTLHTGTYFGDNQFSSTGGLGDITDGSQSSDGDVQFTVLDLASSGSSITRLDLVFEAQWSWLGGPDGVTFGEVQIGEPEPSTSLVVGSRSPTWPDEALGTQALGQIPVWIRNTSSSAVSIGALTASGDTGDFPITGDSCAKKSLSAHAACSVIVAFTPVAAGARSAVLSLPVGAHTVSTTVSGTGSPGTTALTIDSQPGDYVGQGQHLTITDARARMVVTNSSPSQLNAAVYLTDGTSWAVRYLPPGNSLITPGTYAIDDDSATAARLWVTGDGRACADSTGSVTIIQASYNVDNAPTAYDMTFSQTCTGDSGGLTGRVEYHATDGTTPTQPTSAAYADDSFQRTVTSGFGTAAPSGGAWTTTSTAGDLSVAPAHATVDLKPGQTAGAVLGSVTKISTDETASFTLPVLPTGGNGVYLYLAGRRISATEQYTVLARVASGGKLTLTLVKYSGSSASTNLAPAVAIASVAAGQTIDVRLDTVGASPTTVEAKAWVGGHEPDAWSVSASDDSSGLQVAGSPGVTGYLSSATTNGPLAVDLASFDVAQPAQ